MMGWTVGMPMETHLSITAMILGGAFDKLPRSLDLCFAHGGGAFAFLLGRLENAWHEREVAKGKALQPPSHYLDRFSVDSAVFSEGVRVETRFSLPISSPTTPLPRVPITCTSPCSRALSSHVWEPQRRGAL